MTNNLRSLAESATPGPWTWHSTEDSPQWGDRGPYLTGPDGQLVLSAEGDGDGANLYVEASNSAYIAALHPQALLALLDELDKLRTQVGR